ncbi:hypothetical protein C7999DRAFT_16981 [Corynascus novoguineensis]|uniref:Uncharacterized protein n=1 Tax=Corynascus novoguineensis TaxID=1126955 RepID=A0AAN7CMG7_9PEZI|nr:hypothetical protein C7999DRAFT_16981 [Corynascus novoguineensis]
MSGSPHYTTSSLFSMDEADESHETAGSSGSAGSARSGSETVTVQHKTRRPHRKSRYGCTRCKVRRIKARILLHQALPQAEVDLFRHYLEHTSRDRTVGEQDRYTLQVGIPNLACQSRPLMRSVLALAAVCKCCDIIREPSLAYSDSGRRDVVDLLALAHRYHLESLRSIQTTLYETSNYDYVLANAAMMGMYGSASYAARIWLAKTAGPYGDDLRLFNWMMAPGNPQWLSLFRAVRLAYAGLLRSSPQHSPAHSPPALASHYEYKSPPSTPGDGGGGGNGHHHDLSSSPFPVDIENDPVGRLAQISPWLRRYTASISSMIPSKLPRRVIMSLVHRVPTAFLNLIEDMINLIDNAAAATAAAAPAPPPPPPPLPPPPPMPEPSLAHQLAVDIFANWLVLVILLDDVWWIGGIGAWELARFVSVRHCPGWEMCLWNRDRDWWPESMLEISRQLDKHR